MGAFSLNVLGFLGLEGWAARGYPALRSVEALGGEVPGQEPTALATAFPPHLVVPLMLQVLLVDSQRWLFHLAAASACAALEDGELEPRCLFIARGRVVVSS